MNQFTGIIGISTLLGIAYLLSENKKAINYRTVMWGLVLQFVFALLISKYSEFREKNVDNKKINLTSVFIY